jgi:hypothetical protein
MIVVDVNVLAYLLIPISLFLQGRRHKSLKICPRNRYLGIVLILETGTRAMGSASIYLQLSPSAHH